VSATNTEAGACMSCRRRSWLLSALSGPLDLCARDRSRLIDLLALNDSELLDAVAGRRRSELRVEYERFHERRQQRPQDIESTCRHRRGYPTPLVSPAAPPMLEVAGGTRRLAELAAAPLVAVLGSTRASDYGVEMARSLGRGLSAAGVSVVASLTDGIAAAAHGGALEGDAGSVAVMGAGLGACPARRRSLYSVITAQGCAVSELPWDCRGRRWGAIASERIVVGLAQLVVLVEAQNSPGDLAAARIARDLERPVAAIPGRVTSALSGGTHALLKDGAPLVRSAHDVLELLFALDGARAGCPGELEQAARPDSPPRLEPGLRRTLERVGAGWDTPDRLARPGQDPAEVLLALSELELRGLLVRGDGGRYLPRDPLG
jgi:DNA processing protein